MRFTRKEGTGGFPACSVIREGVPFATRMMGVARPPVLSRMFDDPGPDRVELDVGLAGEQVGFRLHQA